MEALFHLFFLFVGRPFFCPSVSEHEKVSMATGEKERKKNWHCEFASFFAVGGKETIEEKEELKNLRIREKKM